MIKNTLWCLLGTSLLNTSLLAAPASYTIQFIPCQEPQDMGYCLQVWTQDEQHYHLTLPLEGDPYSWQWPEPQHWRWQPLPEETLNTRGETLAMLLPGFLKRYCAGQPIFQCLNALPTEQHWHELLPTGPTSRLFRRQAGNETETTENYLLPWISGTATLLVGSVVVSLVSCIVCYQIGKRRTGHVADTSEGSVTSDFQHWTRNNYLMPRGRTYFQGEFIPPTLSRSNAHDYAVQEPPPSGLQVYGDRGLTLNRVAPASTIEDHEAPAFTAMDQAIKEAFDFLDEEETNIDAPEN